MVVREKLLLLSKEELVDLLINSLESNEGQQNDILRQQYEIDNLKRMVFGSRSEKRSAESAPDQLSLGLDFEPSKKYEKAPDQKKDQEPEALLANRKKRKRGKPVRLKVPSDLPVKETVIEPEGDLTEMIYVKTLITEFVDYQEAKLFIQRYLRKVYVKRQVEQEEESTKFIAARIDRPIEKCKAGPGLLARIIVDKYYYHLPCYRLLDRFAHLGFHIPYTTMCGWIAQVAEQQLKPLWDHCLKLCMNGDYLQVDETGIRVLGRASPGKGYYWVCADPVNGIVVFKYYHGRTKINAQSFLSGFSGFLQTDAYGSYTQLHGKKSICSLGCLAHVRRKFFEARKNDAKRSSEMLYLIGLLYAVEKEAREGNLSFEQRKTLRLQKSVPVLRVIWKWLKDNRDADVPDSPIRTAINYAINNATKIMNYIRDGRLEIDNNLVENKIRPVALGRKNYLHAGSPRAAQNGAIIYSMFAMCKFHDVDPMDWMTDVLTRVSSHPINKIDELLPMNWLASTAARN
jgi:transposase